MKAISLAISLLFVIGCGSDNEEADAADAGEEDADIILPAGCAGLLSKYDLSDATYTGYARPRDAGDPTSPMVYGITTILDQGPPRDVFEIQFWSGFGVFGSEVAPGSFPITGAETNLNDCGLCAIIFGDLASNGTTNTVLVAQSGTFTVDEIDLQPGARFRGSAPEIQYAQVNSGGIVPNGCSLEVTNIQIDVTLDSP